MLLTTCPNCAAQFKVQPEQLNVRQGRVMCGRCRHVFNAFESLVRREEVGNASAAPTVSAGPKAETARIQEPTPPPVAAPDLADSAVGIQEVEATLQPTPLAAESLPITAEAPLDTVPPETIAPVATQPETPTLAKATGETAPPMSAPLPATTPGPALTLGPPNPLLQQRKPAIAHPRRWAAGVVVMGILLVLELVFVFRSVLAESVPVARPALAATCELLGCRLGWSRDANGVRIIASDMLESPSQPGRSVLTATLRNVGGVTQDFPLIEVRLTDNASQVVASRVLNPSDYLGKEVSTNDGLAANGEVFINLSFETGTKLSATGYDLRAFYP